MLCNPDTAHWVFRLLPGRLLQLAELSKSGERRGMRRAHRGHELGLGELADVG